MLEVAREQSPGSWMRRGRVWPTRAPWFPPQCSCRARTPEAPRFETSKISPEAIPLCGAAVQHSKVRSRAVTATIVFVSTDSSGRSVLCLVALVLTPSTFHGQHPAAAVQHVQARFHRPLQQFSASSHRIILVIDDVNGLDSRRQPAGDWATPSRAHLSLVAAGCTPRSSRGDPAGRPSMKPAFRFTV